MCEDTTEKRKKIHLYISISRGGLCCHSIQIGETISLGTRGQTSEM